MEILNVEEFINADVSNENKDELVNILEEFKLGHYLNVLSKTSDLQDKKELNSRLEWKLRMVEAVSHTELKEFKKAAEIIEELYLNSDSDLLLLGELAFMCNFKLARRILSDAVNQLQENENVDQLKLARGYLVLAESEEKLEKYVRSIKYYKKGLELFESGDRRDQYMVLYINFKIGMLYSMKNDTDESLSHHSKVIEMAGGENPELKIKSLVSIAKTYGSKNKNEEAFPYLEEALELLEGSTLEDTTAHAEALTEMAFYYFDQSKLTEAVPYYERAIRTHKDLPHTSHRQLGMIYMQYAYCLEHMENKNLPKAGINYENAIERLEKTKDRQLLENALGDVIAYFNHTNNEKKKRYYEEKFVKMANA